MERIAKYLAQCGLASRRKAEEFIRDGIVTVNGELIEDLGRKIDPLKDAVKVGKKLILPPKPIYIIMNKPADVITTRKDTHARKTVYDYLPEKYHNLHPVGRLDKDSTGLLLLTNDGELTHQLTHPKFHVVKVYHVKVKGQLSMEDAKKLEKGIWLSEGKTQRSRVRVIHRGHDTSVLHMAIYEGKNRQVRRMLSSRGLDVKTLDRTTIGPLKLHNLARGAFRHLTDLEKKKLKEHLYEIFKK